MNATSRASPVSLETDLAAIGNLNLNPESASFFGILGFFGSSSVTTVLETGAPQDITSLFLTPSGGPVSPREASASVR